MTSVVALAIAGFAALGCAIGLVDLHALRRGTRSYAERGASVGGLALHAARLGATAVALLLIARAGSTDFLAASAGFVAARFGVVAHAWWST